MAECPAPPLWRPTSARWRPIWLAANQAIEQAYLDQNGHHAVLVGSQFEEGWAGGAQREIRLPYNVPNKEFGDYLLTQLRGPRGGPRKPDIVDFHDRSFYEIKPVDSFIGPRRTAAIQQHNSLYRLAGQIVDEFNETKRQAAPLGARTLQLQDPWVITNSKWLPPKCMTLPGLGDQFRLDTYATDYTSDSSCRGIIIYRVWKKVRRREEESQSAAHVVIVEKDEAYKRLLPSPQQLPGLIGRYDPDEPEHVIIVPKAFDDTIRRNVPIDIAQKLANSSIPPAFDTRTPIGQFRSIMRGGALFNHPISENTARLMLIGGLILVAVDVVAVGVAVGFLVAPEAAAAVGGAAVIEEGGATVISLAARRLAASAAAETLKKAAGIILVLGLVRSARADEISFSKIGAMRAIPLSSITPYKSTQSALSSGLALSDPPDKLSLSDDELGVGDPVMFDSEPHVIVARVVAYPNNLSNAE